MLVHESTLTTLSKLIMLDTTIKPRIIPHDVILSNAIHPLLQRIYKARGITTDTQLDHSTQALLNYKELSDIDKGTQILYQAVAEQKKIFIVGDFDADGATSTALIITALKKFGVHNVDYIIPDRFEDGYGLSISVVKKTIAKQAELIITVDNGVSAVEAVDYAKQHGIQVIITDHHLSPPILPKADAIINPNLPDCHFGSKNLAGVGVTFYFMLAFRALLREKEWFKINKLPEYNLANLLDLVALGTVADVVELDQNNRILVQQGLLRIRSGRCCEGIKSLIRQTKRNQQQLNTQDLSYYLSPRINAAGRMENMSLGVELLLSENEAKANQLAETLESLNIERKNVEQNMYQEALFFIEDLEKNTQEIPNSFVIHHEEFHQGVIGILSSRIKERFYRPVISFANTDDGYLKGSGRSISEIHLRDILEKIHMRAPNLMTCFGGHAMAAGLTIPEKNLTVFKQYFDDEITQALDNIRLENIIETDGNIDKVFLNYDTANILRNSGPWGTNFPEPVFDGIFLLHQQKLIANKHLKLVLEPIDGGPLVNAIAFNIDLNHWPDQSIKKVKIAYNLEVDEFRGNTSINLLIRYLSPIN